MEIETGYPDSQAREARLLADVRSRRPSALGAITTLYGRELTGIAYLVLQHRDGAADAAACGIADVWRRAADPAVTSGMQEFRIALLGATAREALRAHGASRMVDPTGDSAVRRLVMELSPAARAAIGLRLVARVGDEVIATLLEISPRQLRRLLAPTLAEARLPDSIAAQLADLPVTVDPDRVRAALARPSGGTRAIRIGWVAGSLAVGLVLFGFLATRNDQTPAGDLRIPAPRETGADKSSPDANPLAAGRSPVTGSAPQSEVSAFTLADCQIEPVGSPIAFAGWLSAEEIGATGVAAPGQRVYAIVTRGDAEWIGYRVADGRPSFPVPVGRLGCVLDPASGTHTAIGVARRWEPPALADGCPGSPITGFAGYRELGGPRAFVLIDALREWRANDPRLAFLARVAPAPPPGARVEAWLQPVGPGPRIEATVESPPTARDTASSLTHYVHVGGMKIPTPGCWVMNIAIDGTVVGSAVLPISAGVPPAF